MLSYRHTSYMEHQKTDTRLFPLSQPGVYETWDVINFVLCPLYLYFICGCGTCREPIYWVTGCRHSVPADNGSPNQFYFFMTNLDKCKAKKYQISNIFMLEALTKTSPTPCLPLNRAGCPHPLLRKSPSLMSTSYKQTRIIIWDGLITTKPKAANFWSRFWCAREEVEQCLNCGAPSYFQVSSSYTAQPQHPALPSPAWMQFPWVRMEKFAGWRLHLFLQCSGFLMDPYKHKLQQESIHAPPSQTRTGDLWVWPHDGGCSLLSSACHSSHPTLENFKSKIVIKMIWGSWSSCCVVTDRWPQCT